MAEKKTSAPKNQRNGQKKMVKELKKVQEGKVLPPEIHAGNVKRPGKIETIDDILQEQARVYRMVFDGVIHISDMTKLIYGLGQMTQAIKSKVELAQLQQAYSKQWQGVRFIAPPEDPMQDAIENAVVRDE